MKSEPTPNSFPGPQARACSAGCQIHTPCGFPCRRAAHLGRFARKVCVRRQLLPQQLPLPLQRRRRHRRPVEVQRPHARHVHGQAAAGSQQRGAAAAGSVLGRGGGGRVDGVGERWGRGGGETCQRRWVQRVEHGRRVFVEWWRGMLVGRSQARQEGCGGRSTGGMAQQAARPAAITDSVCAGQVAVKHRAVHPRHTARRTSGCALSSGSGASTTTEASLPRPGAAAWCT